MPDGVELRVGGAELLDALEPLWLSLFDHHRDTGAAGLPVIDRALSWPRRRAYYEDDTWPLGDRFGEIESLAVLPAERGTDSATC